MKKTITAEGKRVAPPNVIDMQVQRQRRAARRMAMQTVLLLNGYPARKPAGPWL